MADSQELRDRYIPETPDVYPQVYAFEVPDAPIYDGCIKVGYTSRYDYMERVHEQEGQMHLVARVLNVWNAIKNSGVSFTDHDVHRVLTDRGIRRVRDQKGKLTEFFECDISDIDAAVQTLISGKSISASRINNYGPRSEQKEAIDMTIASYKRQKKSDPNKIPKFLWNAKMRFGKSFTSLEMAKKMNLKKVLIISFKVEVKDSWRDELLGHLDFADYQWVDVKDKNSVADCDVSKPIVAFGSFQDLLGRNDVGGIKIKNEWIHTMNWDLIIFDEYHFGAWRDRAKDLFDNGYSEDIKELDETNSKDMDLLDNSIIPITTEYMLYLSGTPFRAINVGEFLEDQIYNWTYSDEQQAKMDWDYSKGLNPYASMPEMILMTYQLPEACTQIALKGEQNEFWLNEFFRAECERDENNKEIYETAHFVHENEVQRWLDIIRGKADISTEHQKAMGATKPVLPYYDVTLKDNINHSLWYMHSVASCYAMRNLLAKDMNAFYHDYKVIVAAGNKAGSGALALNPVREAMGNPLKSKTITITCYKLTTGVTVRPWSAIFMLTSIGTPESYFQSAFRVQSGWTVKAENPMDPEIIKKPKCYIFDFAPNRALRQLSEYACGLNTDYTKSSEEKVSEFIKFLPVLAFDGTGMSPINATELLDYVTSGTTATLLARKWDSAMLVNVSNEMLEAIINDPRAKEAIMSIEGFRNMNSDVFETIINKSNAIKDKKTKDTGDKKEDNKTKKEISEEEKEIKSQRKQIQENLRKFATRIPLFMYLTDEREQTLMDVITKVEPALFKKVTGIEVSDFDLLVHIGVFNSAAMNEAVAAFRRYEESSLSYTGIDKHYGEKVGLWDISIKREELQSLT